MHKLDIGRTENEKKNKSIKNCWTKICYNRTSFTGQRDRFYVQYNFSSSSFTRMDAASHYFKQEKFNPPFGCFIFFFFVLKLCLNDEGSVVQGT